MTTPDTPTTRTTTIINLGVDGDRYRQLERQLAAAREDSARLRELLVACLPHIPAGAYFGDVLTKPLDEVRLINQVRAAIDAARKENGPDQR